MLGFRKKNGEQRLLAHQLLHLEILKLYGGMGLEYPSLLPLTGPCPEEMPDISSCCSSSVSEETEIVGGFQDVSRGTPARSNDLDVHFFWGETREFIWQRIFWGRKMWELHILIQRWYGRGLTTRLKKHMTFSKKSSASSN